MRTKKEFLHLNSLIRRQNKKRQLAELFGGLAVAE
jgi:hypothetical protein